MNEEESMLEELTKVRPEVLNEPTLKLFNEIMKVIDERDELIRILSKYAKESDKLSEELNKIKNTILKETTTHCKNCPSRMCCNEENCVVYRLEKLGTNEKL